MRLLFLYSILSALSCSLFAREDLNELFDDFNYISVDDNALTEIINWSVVDGVSAPPAGGTYDRNNIEFIEDTAAEGNVIMKVSSLVNPVTETITHARIETADFSYRYGTFAARVYFDDTPALYSDGNVETFYTISPYSTCTQADLYSECDFEYLPWDAWSPGHDNTLYFTTWETCEQKVSGNTVSPLEGWHILVYTCSASGPVKYYVDGELMATHNQFTPDADVNISFANWLFDNITGESEDLRSASMLVDWVYHAQNHELSTSEVLEQVNVLRSSGVLRQDLNNEVVSVSDAFGPTIKPRQIDMQIFPNPTDGTFNVKLTCGENELTHLDILSSAGQKMEMKLLRNYSKGDGTFNGFYRKLPIGIYFVNAGTTNSNITKKLVVVNNR